MKNFKFKDLMINVGSIRNLIPTFCNEPTNFCLIPSCGRTHVPVVATVCPYLESGYIAACQFGTAPCIGSLNQTDTIFANPDPSVASERLAALKVQLNEALRQIEAQQASIDASLQPQTVAEVEELQAKLNEAGSELERRKQELQRKSAK